MFYLKDIDDISISNCDIYSNHIQNHIFETFTSDKFSSDSVLYRNNNNKADKFFSGGMLRSVLSKNRFISKVFVLDSFSYSSTIGLKIIDVGEHLDAFEVKIDK